MFRKTVIAFVIVLLAAFTAACSSSSSGAASVTSTPAAVAASAPSASSCPTSETKKFAKTLFVADVALAGGAFKRYIYTPAKDGKFAKGASGKTLALVKAGAAGLFVINRLDAAKTNAMNDPTLCKLLIAPIEKFSSAISGLVDKAKSGDISPSDVDGANGALSDLHGAASSGGAGFTDNPNATV
jgi:hypothetical protein